MPVGIICGIIFCLLSAGNCHAKQPTLQETGPRIHAAEVRYHNSRRWMGLPLLPRWHDCGDHVRFDGWELPGGWRYWYDSTGFSAPYVARMNERYSLDEVEQMGGLGW